MKIDQMMAEIRETHPEARVGQNLRLLWMVWARPDSQCLAESRERYEAVYSALKAVRKARPKPMTVAQAKAAVKAKYPRAFVNRGEIYSQEKLVYLFDIIRDPDENELIVIDPYNPSGKTEGQAWKAAAAAIQKEEK